MNLRLHALLAFLVLVPTGGWAGEPVRIGVLLSMDGAAGYMGRDAWEGIRDAHWFQPTVLGRRVELVPANTHSEPSQAACAFFRLVEKERVCAVIGDVTASCTLAAAPLAEKFRIPLVSLSGPVSPCRASNSYTLWTGISAEFLGRWCALTCRTTLRASTVAVIQDSSEEFSVGVAEHFARAFRSLGGDVVHRSGLRAGQSNMGTELEQVRRAMPDALFVPTFADQCALLDAQAKGMGIGVPILGVDETICVGRTGGGRNAVCHAPGSIGARATGSRVVSGLISPDQMSGHHNRPWKDAGKDAYLTLLHAVKQTRSLNGDAVSQNMAALQAEAEEWLTNEVQRSRHKQ